MTWVKDSDDVARDEVLRSAGKDAALLWFVAMRECASVDGDGIMSPLRVEDAAHLYRIAARPATKRLVELGLWHDADAATACGPCAEHSRPVPVEHVLIHGWWDHLLHSEGKDDPIKRKREQRRKALNANKPLVAAIRQRDRDLCRYCAHPTEDSSGANKKGAKVRQLDHVDPWGDNTYDNVVVSCRTCNGRKRDRTLEEARMVLLDPGTTRADLATSGHPPDPAGSDPAPTGADRAATPAQPAADPAPARAARETGPGRIGAGQIGPGSGPTPDRVPAHSTNGNGAHA